MLHAEREYSLTHGSIPSPWLPSIADARPDRLPVPVVGEINFMTKSAPAWRFEWCGYRESPRTGALFAIRTGHAGYGLRRCRSPAPHSSPSPGHRYRAPIGCMPRPGTSPPADTKSQLKGAKKTLLSSQRVNAESRRSAPAQSPHRGRVQCDTTARKPPYPPSASY